MSDTHIWNVDVIQPDATGTAVFQETSPQNGDLVHADFTWANAYWHPIADVFATMYILDPNGLTVAVYDEVSNSSGSHQLTYVIDMPGTWTAKIAIWDGNDWVEFADTIAIESAFFEIVLSQSTFESGPIQAGAPLYACVLTVENTGSLPENGIVRLFEYPNSSQENEIASLPITTIQPGTYHSNIILPIYAPVTVGEWPLGIKVYATGENGEPVPVW